MTGWSIATCGQYLLFPDVQMFLSNSVPLPLCTPYVNLNRRELYASGGMCLVTNWQTTYTHRSHDLAITTTSMTTHPCPKTMNFSAGKPTYIGLLYSNVSTPPLTTRSPQLTCRLTPPFSQPLIRVIFLPRRVSICTLFSFTASMIPSASTLSSIIMMIGVLHLYLPTFDVTTSIHRLALLEPATSSVTLLAPPSRSPAPCLSIATSPPSLITHHV